MAVTYTILNSILMSLLVPKTNKTEATGDLNGIKKANEITSVKDNFLYEKEQKQETEELYKSIANHQRAIE